MGYYTPVKILAIDDDPSMTELLSMLLQSQGMAVVSANTGMDGIAKAKSENPDVIVLDLMMPEMDGWQVCAAVRGFSKVPIIILSALDNPGMVASALDAGADDYLIKPVPSNVLIAHIQNQTKRSRLDPFRKTTPLPVTTNSLRA